MAHRRRVRLPHPDGWCDESAADFRRWLAERYGDVDALNDAWSTAFWAQRYDSFDEVLPPRLAPTFPNPAQQLDFARFSDDALLRCYLAEKEVLRRVTPDVPVTTNFIVFDVSRSARAGQPWLLMEQAPSAVNCRDRNGPKPFGHANPGAAPRSTTRRWSRTAAPAPAPSGK